jgi:flagellar basal-body rod protein FlgB
MFDSLEIFNMASGLARHSGARQTLVARNIAHADTPGFRQRDLVSFAESYRAGDAGNLMQRTRATHMTDTPIAGEFREEVVQSVASDPNGNTVTIESEILKTAEIRQQHEMALSVYRHGMSLLRTSLGRR